MPITESDAEPVEIDRKLLEWLVSEVERLGGKVDNAQGFAVNNHNTLAAKAAPPSRPSITIGSKAADPMPAPTARYQVYTPVDSSLNPVWTYLRFF